MEGRMTMTLPMPNEDPGPATRARPKRRIPRRAKRRANTAQRAQLAINKALSLAHAWLSDYGANIRWLLLAAAIGLLVGATFTWGWQRARAFEAAAEALKQPAPAPYSSRTSEQVP